MNITDYLGAKHGKDPALTTAVRELGTWIGTSGNNLVYGGSKAGLMGELAESVLQAGGKVLGIEPQFFIDMGLEYPAITKLIVTKDMAERKALLIANGDAFITFPGGTGTLEEISEVLSKLCLGHLDAPCLIYNLNGYYDHLQALLNHMVEMELVDPKKLKNVRFVSSLAEIKDILAWHSQFRKNEI